MFCPNCGTQNPDAAPTCSKCGFHLKGVAAPKFKGTMLMMNSPSPTPPPPGQRPSGPPPPAVAPAPPVPGAPHPQNVPSKLKGTMVGVAPMAGGARPPGPVAVPPPGAPTYGSPTAPGIAPTGGASFSPPVPQAGVNPLGGTLAADMTGLAAYGASPGPNAGAYGQGAPPAGYGGMGGTQLMPGAPGQGPAPAPYNPPEGANAAGPRPYEPAAAPPPPAESPYGASPFGASPPGYGAYAGPGGGAMPLAPAAAPGPATPYANAGAAAPTAGQGPRRRNALLTWLAPVLVIFGGFFVSIILAFVISPGFAAVGLLAIVAGLLWRLLLTIVMTNELKAVTRNEAFAWWPILVPFYNWYWAWILLPQEVAKAKQIRGVQQPVRNIVLYIFLAHFALASDLNDLAR